MTNRFIPNWGRVAAGVLMMTASAWSHADLAYTFDTDAQGFTVNDPAAGALIHDVAGFLSVKDLTDQTNMELVLPGSAVSGGWLSYLGGTFQFDSKLAAPISSYWPEFGTVTLSSTVGSVALDIAPGDAPGTDWKTYSVKLDAATWGASEDNFRAVLSNLQSVRINLEAGNGAIETVLIDNVVVSAVPEPASLSLALLGLGGVALARRTARGGAGRA